MKPLVSDLALIAARECGFAPSAFVRGRKSRAIAWPRFAVMKVAHENGRTYSEIARTLKLEDQSSVSYGCRRAVALEQSVPAFASLVRLLRSEAAR